MSIAIEARGLGKRYYLNQTVGHTLRRAVGRLTGREVKQKEEFWALKDVDFTIKKGESIGLIGPNGAGKSTLLKILSSVTKQTTGSLHINGRVGALIEVGAGFHPELSGRENIYLNGSILGLKNKEIQAKFDQIVAFAELARFIDTPVKRYSSGMFVRLGFAIAAHINPEILLVDEILAVGDHRFQRKCFGWVRDFLETEQTFFLVSHNMHHIESVCKRVLYVKDGHIAFDGPPEEAIAHYQADFGTVSGDDKYIHGRKLQVTDLKIADLRILDEEGKVTDTLLVDRPAVIELHYEAPTPVKRPKIELAVNCEAQRVGQANTLSDHASPEVLAGKGIVRFSWERCLLTPNAYALDVFVSDGETLADLAAWTHAVRFRVGVNKGFRIASGNPGLIRFPGKWEYVQGQG
jgi:lipopolysaccharide transport system ATP-binding protein